MCLVIIERSPTQFTPVWIKSRLLVLSWPNCRWLVCFFLILILSSNLAFQSIRVPNAASKKSVRYSWIDKRAENSGGIMKESYFIRVSRQTPTKFWINNPSRQQARLAIEHGAAGCTCNPSYTQKMIDFPEECDYALHLLDEAIRDTESDKYA